MSNIQWRSVAYVNDQVEFEGLLGTNAALHGAPTVLVFHGWEGRVDSLCEAAAPLLDWGYQAFVCDLYGTGVTGETPQECDALMQPLMNDRALLASRIQAAVNCVRQLPGVNADALAAMGFCFGGLCVLDLARMGAPVQGVASFHGVFTPSTEPSVTPIAAKVALYHGWDDPLAPPDEVVGLAAELTAAQADWQMLAFGHTCHAFMARGANDPDNGIQYNPVAAARAWRAFRGFLEDCFA